MNLLPLVSVIITTYNRRQFLRRAVESVLLQDYKQKEIIVVDDGSEDNSFEIIEDLPVRYIYQKNKGVSSARNRGIREAKGEYVAFLDSDDFWLKRKLAIQMEAMKRENYTVSYTDEIWLKNGNRINQRKRHKKYSGYIFEKCLPLCIISPSSVVIKRDVFTDVGLFDEELPVCEDYDMWLRITWKYPVLFIEKPLIIKTGGHPDQLSKAYEAIDRFRIQSLFKVIENVSLSSEQKASAMEELKRKIFIYARGAEKRGKKEEVEYLLERLSRLKHLI